MAGDAPLNNYGTGLNDPAGAGGDNNLAMLEKSIPGVPGQDYPILAEVPESSFTCDNQVDGGELGMKYLFPSDFDIIHPSFFFK